MKKKFILSGQAAIFLCAILWSTAGLFIKLIEWHPLVIAGSRSFLAAIFLIVVRQITSKAAVSKAEVSEQQRITDKNDISQQLERNVINEVFPEQKKLSPFVILTGGVLYALTMILFVFANKLTSAANAILLQYASPVWAALLGWLILKEIPNWKQWISLAMVGGGMFIFIGSSLGGGALTGDILAFISGVTFAATSVFMRKAKDHSPINIMILANVLTAVGTIPFFILYPPDLSSLNILRILFLGFIQIGAAAALFSYGIKKVTSVQSLLISTIEPVLNPVWVLIVIGEIPQVSAIIGGSIIILAVLFSSLPGKKSL